MEKVELYAILELSPSATAEDIKTAYQRLARKYHPDLFQNPIHKYRCIKKLQGLNMAYEVLSDLQRRSNYDSFRQQNIPIMPSKTSSEVSARWEVKTSQWLAPVLHSFQHGRFSEEKSLIWVIGLVATLLYWIYLNTDPSLVQRNYLENLFKAAPIGFLGIGFLWILTLMFCIVMPMLAGFIQKQLHHSIKLWREPLPKEILQKVSGVGARIESIAWAAILPITMFSLFYFQSLWSGIGLGILLGVIIKIITFNFEEFMIYLEKSMNATDLMQTIPRAVGQFIYILVLKTIKAVFIVILTGFLLETFSNKELSTFATLGIFLCAFFLVFPADIQEKFAELCALVSCWFLCRFLSECVIRETNKLLDK